MLMHLERPAWMAVVGAALIASHSSCSGGEFVEEFSSTYCEMNNACREQEGLDARDCEAADTADPDPVEVECDYDKVAAERCLKDLHDARCDGSGALIIPAVCGEVCPVLGSEP